MSNRVPPRMDSVALSYLQDSERNKTHNINEIHSHLLNGSVKSNPKSYYNLFYSVAYSRFILHSRGELNINLPKINIPFDKVENIKVNRLTLAATLINSCLSLVAQYPKKNSEHPLKVAHAKMALADVLLAKAELQKDQESKVDLSCRAVALLSPARHEPATSYTAGIKLAKVISDLLSAGQTELDVDGMELDSAEKMKNFAISELKKKLKKGARSGEKGEFHMPDLRKMATISSCDIDIKALISKLEGKEVVAPSEVLSDWERRAIELMRKYKNAEKVYHQLQTEGQKVSKRQVKTFLHNQKLIRPEKQSVWLQTMVVHTLTEDKVPLIEMLKFYYTSWLSPKKVTEELNKVYKTKFTVKDVQDQLSNEWKKFTKLNSEEKEIVLKIFSKSKGKQDAIQKLFREKGLLISLAALNSVLQEKQDVSDASWEQEALTLLGSGVKGATNVHKQLAKKYNVSRKKVREFLEGTEHEIVKSKHVPWETIVVERGGNKVAIKTLLKELYIEHCTSRAIYRNIQKSLDSYKIDSPTEDFKKEKKLKHYISSLFVDKITDTTETIVRNTYKRTKSVDGTLSELHFKHEIFISKVTLQSILASTTP